MNFIKHNFGSYRGYLTHLQARFAAAIGQYAASKRVDWSRVERFVFVCKGNVCRSPYAEARARGLGFQAISFGLDTTGGVPAHIAAERIAKQLSVDLSAHRSQSFDPLQIEPYDLVIAFEPMQAEEILRRMNGAPAQVTLMGLWTKSQNRPYVADPFGKSDEYFQACFKLIDEAIDQIGGACTRSRTDAI